MEWIITMTLRLTKNSVIRGNYTMAKLTKKIFKVKEKIFTTQIFTNFESFGRIYKLKSTQIVFYRIKHRQFKIHET